jgi:hypothetical protein
MPGPWGSGRIRIVPVRESFKRPFKRQKDELANKVRKDEKNVYKPVLKSMSMIDAEATDYRTTQRSQVNMTWLL